MSNGKILSRGLGFFVSQNQVVTNLSNLNDFTPLPDNVEFYVKLVGKRTRYFVDSISVPNRSYNSVLLNVSIPNVKPLPISNKKQHTGPVYSVSNPSKPELVKGTVKGNSKHNDYIRVSNPISEKNLGSPLLNSKGEVIGVSMLLTELRGDFLYDDGEVFISIEIGDSTTTQIRTKSTKITTKTTSIRAKNGSTIIIGGDNTPFAVDESSFAVSSNVLKELMANPKGDLPNFPRQRNGTSNRIEKVFDIDSGGSLIVDTEFGYIDVRTSELDVTKVIVTKESKYGLDGFQKALDDFKVTFNKKGADLTIEGEFEHGRNHWLRQLNNLKIRFQITVPKQYNADLNTPSSNIAVDGISGKLQAQTSAGDVIIKNVTGTLNVQTSAGDLKLNNVKGPIIVESSAGDIKLTNCQGAVDAQTSAGGIRSDLRTQPLHEWSLQTSAGDIVFTLPRDLAAKVDAQTSAGDISMDFQVRGTLIKRNRVRGSINGGGNLLKLRTNAGDIRLKNR